MAESKVVMDALTFISEMTKAVAWPLSILAVLLVFRKRIYGVIDRIQSLKYKDTEVSFGDEFERAKESAQDVGVTVIRPASSFAPTLLSLASLSPTAAIIEEWGALEKELKNLTLRAGLPWQATPQTISALEKSGFLANGLGEVLRNLLNSRNKAVHDHGSPISEGEAIQFLMLSRSVTERVRREAGQIPPPPPKSQTGH